MRRRFSLRESWALVSLALIWGISRVYPLCVVIPWTYWEVWEAKKLLEYGFFERAGGIIDFHFMTGKIANPGDFNYVNHPYPILWIMTLIYSLVGGLGIIAAVAGLGFVSWVLVYKILNHYFETKAAWLGTALYILAPASIFFDMDPSIVAQGSILWPVGVYLILRSNGSVSAFPWKLALAIFIAGQISWFALTVIPAFLVMTYRSEGGWRNELLHPTHNPMWKAMIVGAVSTILLFIAQILIYTPDFNRLLEYASNQSALGTEMSRWKMIPSIVLRAIVLPGFALIFGSALAVFALRGRQIPKIVIGSLIFYCVFTATALLLARVFFRERSLYEYLVFPAAVLTAFALQHAKSAILKYGLASLAFLGFAYSQIQTSIPRVSETSKVIGNFIAENTKAEDLVLTNLQEQTAPFQSWDVGSRNYTALVADRILRLNIKDLDALKREAQPFSENGVRVVFLRQPALPISDGLSLFLKTNGSRLGGQNIDLPQESFSFALQLRNFYWKFLKQHIKEKPGVAPITSTALEIYSVHLTNRFFM